MNNKKDRDIKRINVFNKPPCKSEKVPKIIFEIFKAAQIMDKDKIKQLLLKCDIRTAKLLYKHLNWDIEPGKRLLELLSKTNIKPLDKYTKLEEIKPLMEFPEIVNAINDECILEYLIMVLFCFSVYCRVESHPLYPLESRIRCCYPTRDISYYNEGFVNDNQIRETVHNVSFNTLNSNILSYNKTDLHWHLFKKVIFISDKENIQVNNNKITIKIEVNDLKYNDDNFSLEDNNNDPLHYFHIIPEIFILKKMVNDEYEYSPLIITDYKNISLNPDTQCIEFEAYFKVLVPETKKILTPIDDNITSISNFSDIGITLATFTKLEDLNNVNYDTQNDKLISKFIIFLK